VSNPLDHPFITLGPQGRSTTRIGKSPDHVAVDEAVIRLNDELYWLYAAVDPETNELLHTSLEPTTNTVIDQTLWTDGNTNAYAYKRKGRNESGHIEEERLYVVDGKIRGERQTFDSMGASILTLTTLIGERLLSKEKKTGERICMHSHH